MDKQVQNKIEALGFDKQFHAIEADKLSEFVIARVTSVHKNRFTISNGQNEVFAEMSGKLFSNINSVFDYPVVGDWVMVNFHNSDTFAVIHSILPRKSLLRRKMPGRKIDFQLIAANIDTTFIIQALDADFNIRRLERYLVMINEEHIHSVVLLSKNDLISPEEVQKKSAEIHNIFPNIQAESFNNKTAEGLKIVHDLLVAKKTYCLLGSSGVGKTTLINELIGRQTFKTKEVREKDGKGKHATTSRQLIKLKCGAIVIDTPGMRELGNFLIDEGLDETFSDIKTMSEKCKFNDCTHSHEKGCAVLAAIEEGALSEKRYQNYLKMNKEATYNEMSYIEKRRKDKQFGKMCKDVMKHKKRL